MTLVDEIRKNVTESTPLMAVVGVTDLAVERMRAAAVNAAHLQDEFEKAVAQLEARPRRWQERVRTMDARTMQQLPVVAVHRVLEAAGRVEDSYGRLAERGKDLVDRARATAPAQDLLRQSRVTVSRTRAVVTSARRTIDESAAAARDILTTGRREAVDTASAVETEVVGGVTATEQAAEKAVEEGTRGTRAAVRDAAATVRQRAASTRTAARSASTSARKAVRTAVEAVEAVAAEFGEGSAARSAGAAAPAAEAPGAAATKPGPRTAPKSATRAVSRPATRAGAKPAPKAAPVAPAAPAADVDAPAAPDTPVG